MLSGCIRGIVLLDGCQVDLDQIEARVLAWLADDEEMLGVFRRGEDPYMRSASAIGAERIVGKVAELALGYGGNTGAFEGMAANYALDTSALDVSAIVEAWRDSRPPLAGRRTGGVFERDGRTFICRKGGLWKRYERAARRAIGGYASAVGRVKFSKADAHLLVTLPSGRWVLYRDARVETIADKWGEGQAGDSITYMHPQYGRIGTYGAKIVENVAQAIARDVMAEALVRIPADVVLLVHDEVLTEGGDVDEIIREMTRVPSWAEGLPLGAAGVKATRYAK